MNTPLLDPTDSMPLAFGRFKGSTPAQIAKVDPAYIIWLYENVPGTVSRDLYMDVQEDSSDEEDEYDVDDSRGGWA